MFLDDQLYQKVKSKEINKPEDFKELVNELYKLSEDYYKPKISLNMTYFESRQLMNKVFSFWDFLIKKLKKENWSFIIMLEDAHFKHAFMKNEKLKELYEKGK